MHQYLDLITVFNQCFSQTHNTQLIKGEDEPIYLPADENRSYHAIFFARGFFSSALHECSHWLLAGEKRRLQVDFGYWYVPDGRTLKEQILFQSVEIKPQAIEWILSRAAGYPFVLSIDNLSGESSESDTFKIAVYHQVKTYCERGLPERAATFYTALCHFYGTSLSLCIDDFCI